MNILFIGHSLIEFFDWQERFPAHRAVNLGVAGETVEGLLARVGAIINKYSSADVIVIMTGLNNIAMDDFNFFGPLVNTLEKLSVAYPAARIILTSILPTNLEFVTNESIRKVNISMRSLAERQDIEFMDIYDLFVDEKGNARAELLLDDGVHLSDKGYAVWSKALEPVIRI